MALFFSTARPAYSAQRSERVKRGDFPTFSGDIQIIFPAFETGEKGNTEMKTADCTPNATNFSFSFFLSKEKLSEFPHILNRMAVTLNLSLNFSFYLFLKLTWGVGG